MINLDYNLCPICGNKTKLKIRKFYYCENDDKINKHSFTFNVENDIINIIMFSLNKEIVVEINYINNKTTIFFVKHDFKNYTEFNFDLVLYPDFPNLIKFKEKIKLLSTFS